MPLVTLKIPKLVVTITTTRSQAGLQNRFNAQVWPDLRQSMVDTLNADAATVHVSHEATARVYVRDDGTGELRVKGSLTVDTTRSLAQLHTGFDTVLDDWKDIFRSAIASDSQTSLGTPNGSTTWHVHRSTGSFDETEP